MASVWVHDRERADKLRRHRNETLSELSKPASREALQTEDAVSTGRVHATKRSGSIA
jgi:hypothetical protein